MLRKSACLALLVIVAGSSLGRAQESGLSDEGRAFLNALQLAGWSGHSSANGTDVTVRMAPLCSSGMLNAVRNRKLLSDEQRKALDDVARVILPSQGWYFERLVPAGQYRIGLDFDRGNPLLTLHDDSGRRLASRSFWIHGTTDVKASSSVSSAQGAAVVALTVGNIEPSDRFIPKAQHDALTAGLSTTVSGKVRIHSDLPAKKELEKLAKDAAASLAVHAKLLGCKVPDGPFDVYLFGKTEAYQAIDALLTGGNFKTSNAFTARVTGMSYLAYASRHDADALADHGFPVKTRSLVLHELHHQLAGRAFPHSIENWPTWIAEGLAELGTQRAMQARSRADGKALHDLYVGRWLHADRTGAVPPVSDLVAGSQKSGVSAWYKTCYLLAREMAGKPKRVHELVAALDEEATSPDVAVRARQEFARLYGDVGDQLERAMRAARGLREPPPAVTSGRVDTVDDAWRIVTVPKKAGRILLPTPLENEDAVTLTTTFSFHPSGQQQLDVYLCQEEGRHTEQFLKVAVLPQKIILFWFRHGAWRTCGTVNYDTPLVVGKATERTWHPLTVTYTLATRKVRVETTGGRWAEFDVPGYVPLAGTYTGVGLYNGVAYVKKPTVR